MTEAHRCPFCRKEHSHPAKESDAVEQLRILPDGSVHLFLTSPPYDNLRTYKDNPTFDLKGIIKELYRVLVDGGVGAWVVGAFP